MVADVALPGGAGEPSASSNVIGRVAYWKRRAPPQLDYETLKENHVITPP